jgi:hypothetical protein
VAVLPGDVKPGQVATLQVAADVSAAQIEAVDCAARTLTLGAIQAPGTYALGQRVRDRDWKTLRAGDAVDARIRLELTIYVPAATVDLDSHLPAAHVLAVEPSYRLLTLQYTGGATEVFKVALHARLTGVVPGASVDIHPLSVGSVDVHGRRRAAGEAGDCMPARSPS